MAFKEDFREAVDAWHDLLAIYLEPATWLFMSPFLLVVAVLLLVVHL